MAGPDRCGHYGRLFLYSSTQILRQPFGEQRTGHVASVPV
jgi:hypothetical protein